MKEAASNSERMPHLHHHVLQSVGVFALSVMLVGDVKGCNNAHCYQQSLHRRSSKFGNRCAQGRHLMRRPLLFKIADLLL
jgi:hypothetical protein